jgi:hypothetical protein
MRARWSLLALVLIAVLAYASFPYVTLYRLSVAMHAADAATLETLVDWPSVREGIKEDICDMVVDEPDGQQGTRLPPFGASFMRGIASSTIDQRVTPQAIVAAASTAPDRQREPAPRGADVHVNWAFFDSPTLFSVSLQAQGLSEPIRLEMALRHGAWRIDRVWLPDELLGQSPART